MKYEKDKYWLHVLLFVITFITTMFAGMQWVSPLQPPYPIAAFAAALPYAFSLLFILTFHEFGHYFASKYHGVDATLPFYIPFPPIPFFLNFGTFGAVIKTRSPIPDNKAMFDIGVAGPIAGFIASLIVLIYGFTHLPGVDYILNIHPDYFSDSYGQGALNLEFGDTILFALLREIFTKPTDFIPPMSEVYHYPYLCVGWFGLLITTMNMIPVGQLDGGHVVYAMFGEKKHEKIAAVSVIFLIALGIIGFIDASLELNIQFGWSGWLFWAAILYFFIKIKHPPVYRFEPLDPFRMALGWTSLVILLLSFSPSPFVISM